MKLYSRDEETTLRMGACIGALVRAGDVLLLYGEMGAGKSVLSRGIARGMGVEGPVPSPTFTILNLHEGRTLTLFHFDLYRLESADELYAMGLDEQIGTQGVTLIEWPQRAEEAMPQKHLSIRLSYAAEDGQAREIELTPMGGFDFTPIDSALKEAF